MSPFWGNSGKHRADVSQEIGDISQLWGTLRCTPSKRGTPVNPLTNFVPVALEKVIFLKQEKIKTLR